MFQIKTFLATLSLTFGMVAGNAAYAQFRGEPTRANIQVGEDVLNEGRRGNLMRPLTEHMTNDVDVLRRLGVESEHAYSLAKSADDIYSVCMMLGYSHEEAVGTVKKILSEVVLAEDDPEGEGVVSSLFAAGSVLVGAVLLGSYAIADAIVDYGDTWGPGSSDDGKEDSDGDEGSDDSSGDGESDGGSDDQGDDGVDRDSSREKLPTPTIIQKPVFGPHIVTFD